MVPGGLAVAGVDVCAWAPPFDAMMITAKATSIASGFTATFPSSPGSARHGRSLRRLKRSSPNRPKSSNLVALRSWKPRLPAYRQAVLQPRPTLIHTWFSTLPRSTLQPLIMSTGCWITPESSAAASGGNSRRAGVKEASAAPATKTRRSTIMRPLPFRFSMSLAQWGKIGTRGYPPALRRFHGYFVGGIDLACFQGDCIGLRKSAVRRAIAEIDLCEFQRP